MAAFLQNYVDSVTDLPAELSRCFLLIRELDQKSTLLQAEIDNRCRKHVTDHEAEHEALVGTESPSKRTRLSAKSSPSKEGAAIEANRAAQLDDLDHDVKQVMNYADEKVAVAQQIYDYVDQRIRRLDKDLRAFDAELVKDRARQGLQEDDSNAAAAALEANFPDTVKKNKRRKAGFSAAAIPALAEAGMASAIPPPVDHNEPVYCYCQRVSFGEMIACDNEDCAIEWFHFECVGLTTENRPKGKWYCRECTQLRKAGK